MTIVRVRDGWISLDSMVRVKRDSKDGDKAILKDGTIVEPEDDCFSIVTSLITPQHDWECVIADTWDDDRLSETVEPVLAWGLTVDAMLVPVTPLYPAGVTDPYALRRTGSNTVYSREGSYPAAAEWLDKETKRARRLGDRPQK